MKNLNFNKEGFLLLFAFLLLFNSCSKDEVLDTNITDDSISKIETRQKSGIDFPTVNEDRYYFSSFDEYQSTYLTIDQNLQEGGEGLAVYNPQYQDGLNENENQAPIASVYDKLINDYFEYPEDRYQPFLTDPVAMQLANLHYEIQIEDVLVTYLTNSWLLLSPASDQNLTSKIRQLPKGKMISADQIPEGAYWVKEEKLEEEIQLKTFCGCSIEYEQIDCCRVEIKGKCKNAAFGDGSGWWHVWFLFNPGLSIEINRPVEGNFDVTLDLCDVPQEEFEIETTVTSDCITGGTNTINETFVQNTYCDDQERDSGWLWNELNDEAYSHRTSYYTSGWSKYEMAEMFSKRRVEIPFLGGRQFWIGSNAIHMEASISATRRDNECEEKSSEDEPNDCDDCHKLFARVNTGALSGAQFHCTGDVEGSFEKTMPFPFMPISNTTELEFDCCN